ncbi:glycosyltransferase [Pseudomonas sp. CCI1.2]|uniref:glycosyltransferase n=1 Tax=Pseudomonas sp. CCI1.2 TaxID=3048614 RepID=UPI002B223616|nr:glycosyltransferase [Pseudomonas sp. CCI1.2]MEB0120477.1 glycosyltransferase [Pseudomonas sp. CCI1.2]
MPTKQPSIAVLMAACNGMDWIDKQLSTILDQQNIHVSIFISVDPSSDCTEEWCRSFSLRHQNISLLPAAETFSGAARNFFRLIRDVDFTGYDYIAFADQDDLWNRDKLDRAVTVLKTGEYAAYSSNVTAFWPNGKTLLLDKAQPQVDWDYLFEAGGPGCTYVLNMALAKHLKNTIIQSWIEIQDVSLHDWFCYAFARSQNYRWFIDPTPTMRYRQHAGNQLGANVSVVSFMGRARQISTGWWFAQIKLIAKLVGKKDDPFVARWIKMGRMQLLWLALKSNKCRRRLRDRIAFSLICCWAAVSGKF